MKKQILSLFVVATILGCTGNTQAAAALATTNATQDETSKLSETENEAANEKLAQKAHASKNSRKMLKEVAGAGIVIAGSIVLGYSASALYPDKNYATALGSGLLAGSLIGLGVSVMDVHAK